MRWRRVYCRFFGHRFAGWDLISIPGAPLPWAYCDRCEKEL